MTQEFNMIYFILTLNQGVLEMPIPAIANITLAALSLCCTEQTEITLPVHLVDGTKA